MRSFNNVLYYSFLYSGTLLGKRDLKIGKASREPIKKKRKNENNEESYEAIPREAKWMNDEEVEYLLPIKSGDEIIHQVKKRKDEAEIDNSGKRFVYYIYVYILLPSLL